MSFPDALTCFLCIYFVTVHSEWLLLLSQDTSAPNEEGLFTPESRATFLSNTDDPISNSFSIVGIPSFTDFLNNNGQYQFRLIYDDDQWERIWTQTSWLTSPTIVGSSISDSGFNGLGLCHSPAGSEYQGAMFDGTGIGSYWYYAVGLTTIGWPSYNGLPVKSGYTASAVKLYVCMGDVCDGGSEIVECPLDSNGNLECSGIGCASSSEIEVISDAIYACPGTIASGGTYGTDAQALCNSGYQVCESAVEAAERGLTEAICTDPNIFTDVNQFFGTKETSDGSNWGCYSMTGNTVTTHNDIWGCANSEAALSANAFHFNPNAACTVNGQTIFRHAIGNANVGDWIYAGNGGEEALQYTLTDAASGGVLCCEIELGAGTCPAITATNTFNWDTLTSAGDNIPEVTFTMNVESSDLSLNIEVEVEYIVRASADNQPTPNFGTTYVLDFEDFDAHKSSIALPGSCSNRLASSYNGMDSSTYFTINEEDGNTRIDDIGTTNNMCYPPTNDATTQTGWNINTDGMCSTVAYSGKWTWGELRECRNGLGTGAQREGEEQTFILQEGDINYDEDYLTLSGTFYINMVSPFWYETYAGQSSEFYRVYQLVSQPFIIQVSKSVYVIGDTGINVMTMSIIAVYKEDQDTDYTLILLTEAAEYMKLISGEIIEVPTSPQFSLIMQSTDESNGCLNNKAYLCSQLWKISATDTTCDSNYDEISNPTGGIDFSGPYTLRFTPECRGGIGGYDSLTHCNNWLDAHPIFKNDGNNENGIQEGVALSAELTFIDGICETKTFTVQLEADMNFYEEPNDETEPIVEEYGNIIGPTSDYLYQVGESTVYAEIILDFPLDTEEIFGSTLINVWLCTFPPFPEGETVSPPNQNGPTEPEDEATNGGCFSSNRDGFVDGESSDFFFHIFSSQNDVYNEEFDLIEEGYDGNSPSNRVRFSFKCPHEIERDTLYVHAQVEVLLTNEGGTRRRMLLNVESKKKTNKFAHFGKNIGITNKAIENKPKQPQIPPQQPLQQPPSMVEPFTISLNSTWVLFIGGLLAVILTCNIIFMCYMNCCKSSNGRPRISFNKNRRSGYDSVKHIDSEEFDDSEAKLINVN